jgi:radical SAM superfamily enzyme YgiQ (UPF0313 family)
MAWASAFLRARGFAPAILDLAVEPLDPARVREAALIVFDVPMHTAMRIALAAHARAKELHPRARTCFVGSYAHLNAAALVGEIGADFAVGGESEGALVRLCEALDAGALEPFDIPGVHQRGRSAAAVLEKIPFLLPDRSSLPQLSRYAKLVDRGEERLVGYVEASRGCKHVCRHCPLTPVYGGRFFVVPAEIVQGDVDAATASGATHITFGDPDFFNGPAHALKVVRAMHERHPRLTFDATIKVEHLLAEARWLPELSACGCLFIVSAFESLSDRVLAVLDKGHTADDVRRAVHLVRRAGIALRPSFTPFTPWSTLEDVMALFDFVDEVGLIDDVDPVQLTIRLLVPNGSALLRPEHAGLFFREGSDPLTHHWTHPDARMDALYAAMALALEEATAEGEDPRRTFARLRSLAERAVGRPERPLSFSAPLPEERPPRLTEPWFC